MYVTTPSGMRVVVVRQQAMEMGKVTGKVKGLNFYPPSQIMKPPLEPYVTPRKMLFGEEPFGVSDGKSGTQPLKTNSQLDVSALPDYIRSTVMENVSGAEKYEWVVEIHPYSVALTVSRRQGTTVQIKTR